MMPVQTNSKSAVGERREYVCLFVYLFVFDQDCLQGWISIHQIQLFCNLPFATARVSFCIKMGQPILWSFILAFNTQWIFTVKLKKIQVSETTSTQSCLILTILQTTEGLGGRGVWKKANTKSGAIRSASQGWGLNGVLKGQEVCDE